MCSPRDFTFGHWNAHRTSIDKCLHASRIINNFSHNILSIASPSCTHPSYPAPWSQTLITFFHDQLMLLGQPLEHSATKLTFATRARHCWSIFFPSFARTDFAPLLVSSHLVRSCLHKGVTCQSLGVHLVELRSERQSHAQHV